MVAATFRVKAGPEGEMQANSGDTAGETEDRFLGGRLTLRQPWPGYRAGADAALLAAAAAPEAGERAIEAGCGAGAALLQAAARSAEARFVGVERDPAALALAKANIAANGLAGRVEALAGDVADRFAGLGLERFDAAFANPPFFDDPGALRGPHPARAGAWLADDGLEAWIRFLLAATRDGGRITVIHRADRLADLLALLGAKAGSFRIRPVQPFADAPAKRVLVQARRGGKAPLVLLPALVLHVRGEAAKHTPEVEAILRGETALEWD
jgi:tRNA1(Val) A37 N6-methylase TrmN6